jgi:RNA polymerase-binding protein DksA
MTPAAGLVRRMRRMTDTDREHFRRILEQKRVSIMNDLGLLEHHLAATSAESSGELIYSDHMPDLGSDAMEREKAFMFASRDGAYLNQIEEALRRISEGTYGICRVCDKPIPHPRLEAVPTTKICVGCKEATENGGARRP